MRKFGIFAQTIFFSILLAGVYGMIHDQITYSISPEYFTKFKYSQFGFEPVWFGGDRPTVAIIGFFSSWWVGLFAGFVLGMLGLIFQDHKIMRLTIWHALKIVMLITLIFSVFGFFWGKYYLSKTGVDWWLPENLNDKNNFKTAGSIHNFSYLGGIAGLFAAIVYMIRKKISVKQVHEAN